MAQSDGGRLLGLERMARPKKKKRVKTRHINIARKFHQKLNKAKVTYSDVSPLYDMWRQYMGTLIGAGVAKASGSQSGGELDPLTKDDRLLRADYHGCLLCVTGADNATQLGLSGVVLRETKHTFVMVTRRDRVLTIPKKGSAFTFVLADRVFTLAGDRLLVTPVARLTRKAARTGVLPRNVVHNTPQ